MIYYKLFKSEAAARAAAERWTASTRKDWIISCWEGPIKPNLLDPEHRCDEAAGEHRAPPRTRRRVAHLIACGRPPLQWDGRPLFGIELEARGPLNRPEDDIILPSKAWTAAYFLAAWHRS